MMKARSDIPANNAMLQQCAMKAALFPMIALLRAAPEQLILQACHALDLTVSKEASIADGSNCKDAR